MILNICVITPENIFLNQQVEEIILPTNTGQMGILSNHAPLITALDIGVMLYRQQKKWTSLILLGGFALIKRNKVTILVNEVETNSELDANVLQNQFLLAKQNFEKATNKKQKVEANFIYKRARARYQATQ
uniref:ATP synthase epsilon chain, chloroplastic n=1 Tax=Codium arenicola TaxID=1191365 RepID=A0A2P0QJ13_9CHLO|nr:ATP synthase CF1 subunit epsilon [Codium arenicola]ARO74379.1 ATP synthase CF1 subunit epsilon [Codium arenicola]